ncbi:MAG: LacI family DNA-binding transcriptional regulator, partial [Akkermansia sp.]|nr:LacI family DNA-binding transcriptional regulator [Akkermansia sp.]
ELNVITPDLIVTRDGDELIVTLTGEDIPRLTISAEYREMMSEKAENAELRRYLSRCFREGRELIRAINERQQTILTVAQAIVRRQREFFLRGPHKQIPLQMEDIAADTGVSISTVSRAVRGKFLRCQYGVYELRRFFSAALSTKDGSVESAGSVQARIRALIDAESPDKPLSDAALEAALQAEGITVARRTIAKYREQMKILPAKLRRR